LEAGSQSGSDRATRLPYDRRSQGLPPNTMLVDDILERNRGWVRGRRPQPLPPVATLRLAVVACYDPRLDPLLLPALGLEPGQAFLLRSAGALLQPGSNTMRSLGVAMFMFGVTEVLVVGHAACRMAAFDTAAFIEEFRRRGVPREAFGDDSLRTWAGAIPSVREGVVQSVTALREAVFVPKDVRVAGVVLDETTGALELVVRPDDAMAAAGAGSPSSSVTAYSSAAESAAEGARSRQAAAGHGAASRAAAASPSANRESAQRSRTATPAPERPRRQRPEAAPSPPAPPPPRPTAPTSAPRRSAGAPATTSAETARSAAPGSAAESPSRVAQTRALLDAVDGFLVRMESKEHWRKDVENLRAELERRRDPRQRIELLDAFGRRLAADSREAAESFALLRREIAAVGTDPLAQIISVLRHLGRRR